MTQQTKDEQKTRSFSLIAALLVLCGVISGGIAGYFIGYDYGWTKLTKQNEHVKNITPSAPPGEKCQALTVSSPAQGAQIISPVEVSVIVDNTNPACRWTVFEAQAGTIELTNANGQTIGTGILATTEEWMTEQPVTYTGIITFDPIQATPDLKILIKEENPSGEPGKAITLPLTY